MYKRNETYAVKVGNIVIGGNNAVIVQSMTNTDTQDTDATLKQINSLVDAGAQLVRLAVPGKAVLPSIEAIVKRSGVPIVADIHFDYRLAIGAIEAGVAKIRINPGNIGSNDKVKEIIKAAKKHETAMRIGINMGSLQVKSKKNKVKQALAVMDEYLDFFEAHKFKDIVVSFKASDIATNIKLNKDFAKKHKHPLHLGLTEAGFGIDAIIRSSITIGDLLMEGIGNTIRVSLAGDPVQEIPAAISILQACGLYSKGVEIIACPTCGRTKLDTESLAKEVKLKTSNLNKKIKVAIMGCEVNGPGEAKEADFAICGAGKQAAIYKKGVILKKVSLEKVVAELLELINNND